ncbi:beta strand repeat-containing protein [Novosphingobium pokkalii]|uniref:beta strand repeat-containing protein n=1 Tax=Novosphingobium pokkalii TaxID=1770194 RepID=UPI00364448BF
MDRIDASDNTLSLTVDQAQALGSVALTASDTVTLADTGANLAALTTGQIAALASAGFDAIDATDGSLTLSFAQIDALGTMALTAGNTVIAQGTVAEIEALTPAQLAALATAGVDLLGPTNGEPMLSVAQGQALLTNNLWLTGNTAVLADTGAAIAVVSGTVLEDLYLHGVTRIDATDDVLALSVDQALAVDQSGTALTAADLVTLADSGATLAALSTGAIEDLALLGVDRIDASDNTLSLTVAQFQALDSIALTQADSVTLADTASNLQALSSVEIAALAGAGIDTIHATGGTLTLTAAQALALGNVALVGSDTIVLSDSAAHLEALSAIEIAALATAGIDRVEASGGSLALSVAQAQALGTIALTPANTVTLADTGANLAALSATDLAALTTAGIDAIDASDDTLNLTVAQAEALAGVTLTVGDMITLADSGANLAALGTAALADLATRGFDGIDASDNVLTLSLEQVQALGSVALTAGDLVTVVATGAQFAALTAQDFSDLAATGVDALATTDHVLALTVAQIQALGGLALASDDTITLADSSATIAGLSAATLADLVAQGVDHVSFIDQSGEFDAEHALALTGATLADGSTLTVLDDAATLRALSPTQWAALAAVGADTFATNSQTLTLDTAQALAIGDMVPANGNTLVIEDAGAAISDLTPAQIAAFAGKGSVVIHVQDDGLVFTKAQIDASEESSSSTTTAPLWPTAPACSMP